MSTLSVTNPGTYNGAVGDSVALQIQASGLPSGDSWTYAATGLPSGLSINTSSGQIDGTITGSGNAYSITVTASDGQGASASQSFTWNVSTLSVTNPGTHNGAVGDSAALQIQSGGLPSGDSWTYAATGLPSGLSINTSSGQIDGTITGSANAYSVSVTASDGQGASASQSFTWNVSTLSVTNPGTYNGAVGDSAALQIQASGLPSGDSWTYAATGLPSGLSINTSSGQIDGTLTGSANTYSISVTASDGQGGSASQSFTWNVSTLSVTNPGTYNGAVGESASLQIQASGLPSGDNWFYSASGLPSGLSINTRSGLISGKISAAPGAYAVSVTAGDGQGASALQNFTWNVGATTSTVTSRTNPSVYGHRVTFAATITSVVNGSGKPTGTVTFLDGTKVLHTVHLRRGKAKFTTSAFALSVGRNSITVSYSGSSSLAPSTSAVFARRSPRADLDEGDDGSTVLGYGGPGQHRRCYHHRNLGDAGQAQDHRGLPRRYESNLFQGRGDDSSNSRMVVAQTVRQRSQAPSAAVPRSPNVSAAARRTAGCRSASAWERAGIAATASAPKRRKASTAANRTMVSVSAVAIVATLGRTPRTA